MASQKTQDDSTVAAGPVTAPAFRVLFVCIGNVCRSPLGERLLRAALPEERFVVESAGINGLEGSAMSPEAAGELVALGGDASGFVARRLTEQMVRDADLVLAATTEIRSRVLGETPSALRRTFTVREFAALLDEVDPALDGNPGELRGLVARAAAARSRVRLEDPDIPDPYRRPAEAHALAARLMAAAVDRIAKGLDR
jgi:protein-tyrosine phosphatase